MSSLMSNSSKTPKSEIQVVFAKAKERIFKIFTSFTINPFIFSTRGEFPSVSDVTPEIMSLQFCATLAH